jgi:hypothetical protein
MRNEWHAKKDVDRVQGLVNDEALLSLGPLDCFPNLLKFITIEVLKCMRESAWLSFFRGKSGTLPMQIQLKLFEEKDEKSSKLDMLRNEVREINRRVVLSKVQLRVDYERSFVLAEKLEGLYSLRYYERARAEEVARRKNVLL